MGMNEYSDDFKGVRFPKDLWLDKNISLIEKGILVVIKNLDKSDEHCRATNNYLAEFLQCSVPTITRAIAHLKQLGYVEEI
jgi:Mn-dependent DtxR family transcriptional regulator